MILEFIVVRVQNPTYVDINDFSGYAVPGKVVLHTVDQIPVDQLPCSDLEQYGNAAAQGRARIHIREARRLLGHEPRVGDRVLASAAAHRSNGMRKGGFFFCTKLRPVFVKPSPAESCRATGRRADQCGSNVFKMVARNDAAS